MNSAKITGENAIQEIISKVSTGEYVLVESKYYPTLTVRHGADWVAVKSFHPMTVRAAKARLVARLDTGRGLWVYGVAA